jgi:hypothetical protein
MTRMICFIALLAVAGISLWLGIRPEEGFAHGWLSLTLVALFAASEARFWNSGRRNI